MSVKTFGRIDCDVHGVASLSRYNVCWHCSKEAPRPAGPADISRLPAYLRKAIAGLDGRGDPAQPARYRK